MIEPTTTTIESVSTLASSNHKKKRPSQSVVTPLIDNCNKHGQTTYDTIGMTDSKHEDVSNVDVECPKKKPKTRLYLNLGLILFVQLYVLIGAIAFDLLESEAQESHVLARVAEKEECMKNFSRSFVKNETRTSLNLNEQTMNKAMILVFKQCFKTDFHLQWHFTQAAAFAFSVVTVLGFGNVTVFTNGGKLFYLIYAFIGIPLIMTVLANLGKFMVEAMTQSRYSIFTCTCLDGWQRWRWIKFIRQKYRSIRHRGVQSADDLKTSDENNANNNTNVKIELDCEDNEIPLVKTEPSEKLDLEKSADTVELKTESEDGTKLEEADTPEYNWRAFIAVFAIYVACGTFVLVQGNDDMTVLDATYANFRALTADFAEIAPQRVIYMFVALIYVCIGVMIVTTAFELLSVQLRKLHFTGQPLRNVSKQKIWFGGRRMSVGALVKSIGSAANVDSNVLKGVRNKLDTLIETALEGKDVEMVEEAVELMREPTPKKSTPKLTKAQLKKIAERETFERMAVGLPAFKRQKSIERDRQELLKEALKHRQLPMNTEVDLGASAVEPDVFIADPPPATVPNPQTTVVLEKKESQKSSTSALPSTASRWRRPSHIRMRAQSTTSVAGAAAELMAKSTHSNA